MAASEPTGNVYLVEDASETVRMVVADTADEAERYIRERYGRTVTMVTRLNSDGTPAFLT